MKRLAVLFLSLLLATAPAGAQNGQPSIPGGSGPCSAFGSTAGTCAQGNDSRIPAGTGAPWTPTDQSGAGLTFTIDGTNACNNTTNICGTFQQIGNYIFVSAGFTFATTASASSALVSLPFTVPNKPYALCTAVNASTLATALQARAIINSATVQFTGNTGTPATNVVLTGVVIRFTLVCPVS